jgi:subtilase family serine protease
MKNIVQNSVRYLKHLSLPSALTVSVLAAFLIFASNGPGAVAAGQAASISPAIRISSGISTANMTVLPGSKHPMAQVQFDAGRLPSETKLQGISMFFSRTDAQEADLKTLMASQQNTASPLYHQWLTPDQFAARFGMSDADLAKVQSWLEQQGFAIESVNRSKNLIRFSGTSGQVESAFATEMHSYNVKTSAGIEKHFAPSTALSVPSSLAGVVQGIRNLDDFRPRSHLKRYPLTAVHPNYTDSTGANELAPADITTIYDIAPLYNSGITGAGQSIALVGQSDVDLSDVSRFRAAAGLPATNPTKVLVPGSGAPYFSSGDESESDLDLEWSGAVAKSADLIFVYTGDNTNYSAFDSILYAIDQRISPIISSSYGDCELNLSGTLETNFEQAAAQGQTVLSASGDDGSTDCYPDTSLPISEQGALAVDYPASSQFVTGVGGTQFAGDASSASTYWSSSNATGGSSAISYIPETVWNEDSSTYGLSSGGGGASVLFAKPTWQVGTGVPADGARDVPDVALDAANEHDPYLFCSSDISYTGVTGSCSNGFLDATSKNLTTAGGTSFAAPIFGGILALINQQQNSTGQGLINPTLYALAANATNYSKAFHDITTGNNDCSAGGNFCLVSGSSSGYSAATGYDQASGLGTIDAYNLASVWPANAAGTQPALLASVTSVSASSTTPALAQSVTFTVNVNAAGGTPSGNVSFTIDGIELPAKALVGGSATTSAVFTTAGNHVVEANYSGDSTYAASVGTASINVLSTAGSFSFTPATSSISISSSTTCSNSALDGNGTSAYCDVLTVSPSGGYSGSIDFQATTTNATLASEGCWNWDQASVSGGAVTNGTIYISVNSNFCSGSGVPVTGNHRPNHRFKLVPESSSQSTSGSVSRAGLWTVSLLIVAVIGFRVRKLRGFAAILFLVAVGVGMTACGGSSGGGTTGTGPTGVPVTVIGTDTVSPSITSSTTITVVVQ